MGGNRLRRSRTAGARYGAAAEFLAIRGERTPGMSGGESSRSVAWRCIFGFVFAVLLSGCGNYKTEEYEVGYRGPARTNPLLAAERLLTKLECQVDHMDALDF